MGMFDDDPVAGLDGLDVAGGFVQGRGPGHAQHTHARRTRTAVASQEPDRLQRAGGRIADYDTPQPQQIPTPASTDSIEPDQVAGIESAHRPGQTPLPGWDGEMDAFAPNTTRPTVW